MPFGWVLQPLADGLDFPGLQEGFAVPYPGFEELRMGFGPLVQAIDAVFPSVGKEQEPDLPELAHWVIGSELLEGRPKGFLILGVSKVDKAHQIWSFEVSEANDTLEDFSCIPASALCIQKIDQEPQGRNGFGVFFEQTSKFCLGTREIPGLGEPLGELAGGGWTGFGVAWIYLRDQLDCPREVFAGGHDLRGEEKCRRSPLEIAQASSSFFCPRSDSAFFRRTSNGSLGEVEVVEGVGLEGFASGGLQPVARRSDRRLRVANWIERVGKRHLLIIIQRCVVYTSRRLE